MKKRLLLLVCTLVLLLRIDGLAQLAPERLAWNNLGKERWLKAEMQIKKSLRKDSLNLGAQYAYAWFYFTLANPKYDIDSASLLTTKTSRYFQSLSKKEREKNIRFPFDSIGLRNLRIYIDSAAFGRAKQENTEASYTFFIEHFKGASQLNMAMELQQEVAFLDALKENTYQSFEVYLKRYPQSARHTEASSRYHKLLFDSKTKDKRLTSYLAFLQAYPNTPYRKVAEKEIFQLSTASGEMHAYQTFIKNHPTNAYVRQAGNFLFYILKNERQDVSALMSDSLIKVMRQEGKLWTAIWKNGLYAFMDADGREHLLNRIDSLETNLLCNGFTEDILLAKNRLITRAGVVLAEEVIDYEDLGFGFLLIERQDESMGILHKSGTHCLPHEAKLLGHYFFFSKSGATATLYTLHGRKVLAGDWQDVFALKDVIVFKSDQGFRMSTARDIGAHVNGSPISFTAYYDEVEALDNQYLLVRQGSQRALLRYDLSVALPLQDQEIHKTEDLIIINRNNKRFLYNQESEDTAQEFVAANSLWLLRKDTGQYFLTNRKLQRSFSFDSARLMAQSAIGFRKDSTMLLFEKHFYTFSSAVTIDLLSHAAGNYVMVSEGDRKTIFSSAGERQFALQAEKMECISDGLFVQQKRDKRILLNDRGLTIPLPTFDAFGNTVGQTTAVLAKKKFGLIHRRLLQVIKPTYDRNLVAYNEELVVAYKNGYYGFIGWDDKAKSKFEFDEVKYWNDSVALVKHSFVWRLFDLNSFSFRPGKITAFTEYTDSSLEHFLLYKQDNFYGLMTNRRGILLEPVYSSIENVGSPEEPFYRTDKYVEEAAVHIVIYYNQDGKQVARYIYEEEEFAKLLCPD